MSEPGRRHDEQRLDAPPDPGAGLPRRHYWEWTGAGRRRSILLYLLLVVLGYVAMALGAAPLLPFLDGVETGSMQENVVLVYGFVLAFVAIPVLVKLLLGRPAYSVALPSWPPRWADYLIGWLGGWAILAVTTLTLSPWRDIRYVGWGGQTDAGALLLVATVVGLLIQTATEELYFRGVLMQATYRILRWTPVVLVLQALFFAQLHVGNIEAWGDGWTAGTPYFLAALAFGFAAWRSGSLMLPAGLHFGNNTFVLFFVSVEGDVLRGPSPWVFQAPTLGQASVASVLQLTLTVFLVLWVARLRPRPRRRETDRDSLHSSV